MISEFNLGTMWGILMVFMGHGLGYLTVRAARRRNK